MKLREDRPAVKIGPLFKTTVVSVAELSGKPELPGFWVDNRMYARYRSRETLREMMDRVGKGTPARSRRHGLRKSISLFQRRWLRMKALAKNRIEKEMSQ